MIPLKLQLKNFMSYGTTQYIDFEPYSLICLAGKNGHGKSALLEGLTWAIWGQARKATAKADEGLLRLGQTHMMVSADFLSNGITYRVKREFTLQAQKGFSSLEFGILDKETDAIRPLTDKTIRATQAKIDSIVGLDYDSFINSAFLKQGQSNEFSTKTPKERKDILASILGLNHFEELRTRALEKAKNGIAIVEQNQALFNRFQQELLQKNDILAQFTILEENLQQLHAKDLVLKQQLEFNQKKYAEIALLKNQIETLNFKKSHLEKNLDEILESIRALFKLWRSIHRFAQSKSLPGTLAEQQAVQAELQQLQMRAAEKTHLTQEFLEKKEQFRLYTQALEDGFKNSIIDIQRKEHVLETAYKAHEQKTAETQKKLAVLTAEQAKLEEQFKVITTVRNSQAVELAGKLEPKLERRKAYFHLFASLANGLTTHLQSLAQKKQFIEHSDKALCPLCEQEADKQALHRKLDLDEKRLQHQLKRLNSTGARLKKVILTDIQAMEGLKKEIDQIKVSENQLLHIENQKLLFSNDHNALLVEMNSQAERARELVQLKELLKQETTKLKESFDKTKEEALYKKTEQEIAVLKQKLEATSYSPEKEKLLIGKLQLLTTQINEQQDLYKQISMQSERRQAIIEKSSQARHLKNELKLINQSMQGLVSSIASEDHLIKEIQQINAQTNQLVEEKNRLLQQKGSLETQLNVFSQKEVEAKGLEALIQSTKKLVNEYTAIANAMGKDGIQALLIEDALPEIESEANDLLARLTDNQAHISIESLKDLRSGKTKETLDIKISDNMGIRPYELFSGGEAFRIDFALRVALSKLLARRAGTSLQTLIIDEGFGSQDDEGIGHIMEVLHTIQDDFSKIIVVSHIPALKEQFPTHFHIQKTAQGSSIDIIEHC